MQGEGLLAVAPHPDGPVHIFSAGDLTTMPSIRAELDGAAVRVTADGPVEHTVDAGVGGIEPALARWAQTYAARHGAAFQPEYPTVWCPWYQYFTKLTEADMYENIDAIDELDLAVDVVAVDDAFQKEIGDWLALSDRFSSLPRLVDRIHASGRRAGVWIAPLWVGARSDLYRDHRDWLVQGADGEPLWCGNNWDQDLYALDVTHPGAAAYLTEVFETWRGYGFDYFKADFLFAGAVGGRRHAEIGALEHYRLALRMIREAVGADATLLGCGAPLLPSIGLVDAMRVSCDVDSHYAPASGDISQPSQAGALLSGRSRAFMHGRFWHNDPDCIIVRPEVERREEWAEHIRRHSGVRAASDRLRGLDDWGLRTTRELLVRSTATPLVPA
ncbi:MULTISPECIES: glycoside hydrolase family 36 protein [unclassified Micromonospora]|uniref:glycoside hydrolase family 36 protein n=1 Tax=unclassified Micromonospora TaxID=2617518 RepID=UPI002491F32C|nr:glycoside hydrolase family 36 protein [Micromonospora sp. AKA38]